jgi:hypothetical protein
MRPRTIDLESLMTEGVAMTETAIARIFEVPLADLAPELEAVRRFGCDGRDFFEDGDGVEQRGPGDQGQKRSGGKNNA